MHRDFYITATNHVKCEDMAAKASLQVRQILRKRMTPTRNLLRRQMRKRMTIYVVVTTEIGMVVVEIMIEPGGQAVILLVDITTVALHDQEGHHHTGVETAEIEKLQTRVC